MEGMATILKILIFASIGWIIFQIILIGFFSKIKSLGRPPLAWSVLALAKIAIGVSLCLMLWEAAARDVTLAPFEVLLFLILMVGGVLLITFALFGLGSDLRMGIPDERTSLVTSSVYRASRNPIYLGIFLIMGASLLYAFSWWNVSAVAIAVFLHHRIVLAEEKFLAGKFAGYEAYRRRVRRYV